MNTIQRRPGAPPPRGGARDAVELPDVQVTAQAPVAPVTAPAVIIVHRAFIPQEQFFVPGTDTPLTMGNQLALGPIAGGTPLFPSPIVWVEELHTDNVIITEHPVERGAPITDHAFARGPELTVRLGWGGFGFTMAQAQSVYSTILGFKNARTLFTVQTGKRQYTDMLISEMSVTTNEQSEYVLLMTLRLRQLILVNTSVVSVQSAPQNQSVPSSTTPAVDNGQAPIVPAPNFNPAGLPAEGGSGGFDPLTGQPLRRGLSAPR